MYIFMIFERFQWDQGYSGWVGVCVRSSLSKDFPSKHITHMKKKYQVFMQILFCISFTRNKISINFLVLWISPLWFIYCLSKKGFFLSAVLRISDVKYLLIYYTQGQGWFIAQFIAHYNEVLWTHSKVVWTHIKVWMHL